MLYFLLGILAPVFLNLIHLLVGIYLVVKRGSVISLGFTGIGFVTKTIGMLFLTWLGVGHFQLNFKIFVPLLSFFWFFTHIIEAFIIQHYMKKNESDLIKSVQI